MDLSKYVGKYVRIDLVNNFYYMGVVTNADENSLEMKDKNGKDVSLNKSAILFIREV